MSNIELKNSQGFGLSTGSLDIETHFGAIKLSNLDAQLIVSMDKNTTIGSNLTPYQHVAINSQQELMILTSFGTE